METKNIKRFPGTPFIIECTSIENKPGQWNSSKISIFRDDILIGEYLRNYANYAPNTFYPFLIENEWYALYSADYTTTRVMKLHDDRIEDWCGEESSAYGFCPVELYVPRYNRYSADTDYYVSDTEYATCAEFIAEQEDKNFVEMKYHDFGFLCGCVWGDDTSWKLRYIDLSKVPDKQLEIFDRFGYWEIPSNMKLKECINMRGWEPRHNWIELTRMEHFNLKTGERC